MTGRDLRWRLAGVVLTAVACTAGLFDRGSPLTVPCFLGAMLGIVLMLNGKRVAVLCQAERRGHGETAAAIHAGRRRRAALTARRGPSS